jgi:exodeoxyribonuclease-5
MNLTEDQDKAIGLMDYVKRRRGVMAAITGYAGTGKTTCIKVLHERQANGFYVLTPTGKAASVVKERTGHDAKTIHRWLYHADINEDTGEVSFRVKNKEEIDIPPSGLVIIDEASMITASTWEDILRVRDEANGELNIVLMGDNFQLPPVDPRNPDFSALQDAGSQYSVHMTEIVRQALENPIIQLSVDIRNKKDLFKCISDKDFPYLDSDEFVKKAAEFSGKGINGTAICHANKTRHAINTEARKILGYNETLQPGEPILVMKNNYVLDMYNGEIYEYDKKIKSLGERSVHNSKSGVTRYVDYNIVEINGKQAIISEKEIFGQIEGLEPWLVSKNAMYLQQYNNKKSAKKDKPIQYLSGTLGYCLSCHKSQGSDWDEVAILLEPTVCNMARQDHRWIYTAITRAKKNLYFSW